MSTCGKCGSNNVFPHLKGFSLLQAVMGMVLVGFLGWVLADGGAGGLFIGILVGVFMGAVERRKLVLSCADCGFVWKTWKAHRVKG